MVTALHYIARGDGPPPRSATRLPSPLANVNEDKWSRFVRALASQELDASTSNGLGRFAMRPRRLGDLGLMTNLRRVPDESGRMIWTGDFVLPLTCAKFLGSLQVQVSVLVKSITAHATDIAKETLPPNMSKSGALAILHCAGPGALRTWTDGPRFERTVETFNKANGIF